MIRFLKSAGIPAGLPGFFEKPQGKGKNSSIQQLNIKSDTGSGNGQADYARRFRKIFYIELPCIRYWLPGESQGELLLL